MERKIKILHVEDEELISTLVEMLLREHTEFEIVGQAANGKEAVKLLKRIHADIVLLDIEMPQMNGRETLDKLLKLDPDLKIIMLSVHTEPELIIDYISSGAMAYLPKGCSKEKLVDTIKTVHEKGIHVTDEIMNALIKQKVNKNPQTFYKTSLSNREIEVLKEISKGITEAEIAINLGIAKSTVHTHKLSLFKKTQTHNITLLIRSAIKKGLI